jgi:hypothetical protein
MSRRACQSVPSRMLPARAMRYVVRVCDPQVEMLLRSCDDSAFAQQRFDLSDRLLAEFDLEAELFSKFFQDDLRDDELVFQQDVRE